MISISPDDWFSPKENGSSSSQGINESANFRRDCPAYLASAETFRDLLLPAETIVLGK